MSFRMKNVALKERNIILKNNIKKRNLSFFQKIYIKVKCDVNIFKILLLKPKNNLFKIFLNIFLKPYLLLEILRLKIIKRI